MRKKSTLRDCDNWRVITLLSIPRKNLDNDCHQADIRCSGEKSQEGINRVQEKTGIAPTRSEGAILKMRKKSTLRDCDNWRVITLLSIPRKNLDNDCHQADIRCSGEKSQEGINRVQEKTGIAPTRSSLYIT